MNLLRSVLMMCLLAMAGCEMGLKKSTPAPKALPESAGLPADGLATGSFAIQDRLDEAENGSEIYLPLGRYVSAKGLQIKERRRLTIRCEPGTEILVRDLNDAVLNIVKSQDIRILGAHLRHLKPSETYQCHGAVVALQDCRNIQLAGCELDGCGAIGVSAKGCNNVTVEHCHIHDNTFNAFYIENSTEVKLLANVIENNQNLLQTSGVVELDVSDNDIRNNGGYWRPKVKKTGPDGWKEDDAKGAGK